jgi:hypothetical protein
MITDILKSLSGKRALVIGQVGAAIPHRAYCYQKGREFY